jgi:hypothetical protein
MLLNDLRASFHLYAVCNSCDRMEPVSIPDLLRTLPADTPISLIRQRVRCRGCNLRTNDIRIVYVGEGERSATFQYRR